MTRLTAFAFELDKVSLLKGEPPERNAIDVGFDAGQSADDHERTALSPRSRCEHGIRHHDAEIAAGVDAGKVKTLTRERRNRQRRLL